MPAKASSRAPSPASQRLQSVGSGAGTLPGCLALPAQVAPGAARVAFGQARAGAEEFLPQGARGVFGLVDATLLQLRHQQFHGVDKAFAFCALCNVGLKSALYHAIHVLRRKRGADNLAKTGGLAL